MGEMGAYERLGIIRSILTKSLSEDWYEKWTKGGGYCCLIVQCNLMDVKLMCGQEKEGERQFR